MHMGDRAPTILVASIGTHKKRSIVTLNTLVHELIGEIS
jgi:hypothetical protein